MSENPSSIETVLAVHRSRDVCKPPGWMVGWGCTCGWGADGGEALVDREEHVAAAIREHLLSDAVIERAAVSIQQHSMPPHPSDLARAALTAATTKRTDRD